MAQEVMYETGKRKNKATVTPSGKSSRQAAHAESDAGWEEQMRMSEGGDTSKELGEDWQAANEAPISQKFSTVKEQFNQMRGQVEQGLHSFLGTDQFSVDGSEWADRANLAEIKRWSALIGGGFLALWGLRRSLGSLTLMGIGAGFVYYALNGKWPLPSQANRSYSGFLHTGRSGTTSLDSHRPMTVQSVIVKAPVKEVYEAWANFENFPRFMQHIRSVTKTGNNTSHWVMDGPFHSRLEWDAETTRLEENKRIAWSSTGGDIKTSGQVTFNTLPDNEVEVTVMLRYVPPAGIAGDLFAALFGDPEGKLAEDLRNFKRSIEQRARAAAGA